MKPEDSSSNKERLETKMDKIESIQRCNACLQRRLASLCEQNRIFAEKTSTILHILENQGLHDNIIEKQLISYMSVQNTKINVTPNREIDCPVFLQPEGVLCNSFTQEYNDFTKECNDGIHHMYMAVLRLMIKRKRNRAAKNNRRHRQPTKNAASQVVEADDFSDIQESNQSPPWNLQQCRKISENREMFLHIDKFERLQGVAR